MTRSKLRIAFISEGYPPTDGGIATSTQRVAKNLTHLGCKVLVLAFDYSGTTSDPDYAKREIDDETEVLKIGPFFKRRALDEDSYAVYRRRLFDQMHPIMLNFSPDVIMSFYAATAGLLAGYLAGSLKVPHVMGVRGNDVGRNVFSTRWLPTLTVSAKNSAAIVCVNDHLKERFLLPCPELAPRTKVIFNGMELPAEIAQRRARSYLSGHTKWARSDIVAVFIGTPREKKGIATLLRAFALIGQKVPIRLLIVGPALRPDERLQWGDLWDKLATSGALHATGQLARADALAIAQEGDIVLMPSIEDGLANGLLEGMGLGLCPVVSDLFQDVVPQGCGWVVPRNSPAELAAALEAACRFPAKRKFFSAAAKSRVARCHSARVEAAAYLKLFQGLDK